MLIGEELGRIRSERGPARFEQGHFRQATHLFDELVSAKHLEAFLTLKAYDLIDPPLRGASGHKWKNELAEPISAAGC